MEWNGDRWIPISSSGQNNVAAQQLEDNANKEDEYDGQAKQDVPAEQEINVGKAKQDVSAEQEINAGKAMQQDAEQAHDGDVIPIIFEQDLSAIQDIIVDEAPEEILDSPILTLIGPVEDPVHEYDCEDYDQDEFKGWEEEDIVEDAVKVSRFGNAGSVWSDYLELISNIDPPHEIFTIVSISDMKVKELMKELKSRGLQTSGTKNKLINRLQTALDSTNPSNFNEDKMELQAGIYDSDSDSPKEDIGLLMERQKKPKPKVEARTKRILDMLQANTPVKDICKEISCGESTVYRVINAQNGGKAAEFEFKRKSIVQLLEADKKPKEICRIVKCSPSTLFKVMKQWKMGQNITNNYQGGKRTVRTEEFIEGIWSTVCADPSMKMRRMAKHIGASQKTVWRAVREDLCLYPYKHRVTQLIPQAARPKRVKRGKIILPDVENPDLVKIWTDEKQWDVDSTVNNQNDRFLAYCVQDVPEKHRTTRPSGAMMLGIITSDGKSMPPLWIDKGAKVDSKVYIELLKKVKTWLDETYGDHTPYVFMQDGAPSHVSEDTQKWCKNNFKRFWRADWWPPYSPDLNPLDFNIWGYVESKACAMPHSSVKALQESVDKYWKELLTVEHVKKTCSSVPHRIHQMIEAKGGTFEPRKRK